jgi:exodeoxyribonuclease VII large subunit
LLVSRLGRPSHFVIRRKLALQSHAQRLAPAVHSGLRAQHHGGATSAIRLFNATHGALREKASRLDRLAWRLAGLDPTAVLQRGYALLTNAQGAAITSARQVRAGQSLRATLADGVVDLRVAD